ncbi:MAG: hypothetical protein PHT07_03145 [Paludibacter sp.]|nr:hypothetical protein [Paludibacter sp.]
MKEKNNIIVVTSLISLGLLIIFFALQLINSDVLDLDVKWIIVSASPVIIGLILSGIIKSFKGFGVELELNLLEKVESGSGLIGRVECFPTTELTKQSTNVLFSMSEERRNSIERLQLISGKINYYDYYALNEYIQNLRRLKYIEFIDNNGRFQALLSVNSFRKNHSRLENNDNLEKIEALIQSVEREDYKDYYRSIITETILLSDSLIVAYKKFQRTKNVVISFSDQILPVLDSNDKMIGITSRIKLTEKIAEQVVKSEK